MFQTAKPNQLLNQSKPASGLVSLKAKHICFQIVEEQGLKAETQSLDLDEVEVTVRKLENPKDFMGFSQMLCFKAKSAADSLRKVQELLKHHQAEAEVCVAMSDSDIKVWREVPNC